MANTTSINISIRKPWIQIQNRIYRHWNASIWPLSTELTNNLIRNCYDTLQTVTNICCTQNVSATSTFSYSLAGNASGVTVAISGFPLFY